MKGRRAGKRDGEGWRNEAREGLEGGREREERKKKMQRKDGMGEEMAKEGRGIKTDNSRREEKGEKEGRKE